MSRRSSLVLQGAGMQHKRSLLLSVALFFALNRFCPWTRHLLQKCGFIPTSMHLTVLFSLLSLQSVGLILLNSSSSQICKVALQRSQNVFIFLFVYLDPG